MAFPPGRWALVLAVCLLAATAVPTASQGDTAVPAEPLPEDVQLLFDLELRGPPGGASNLLPWTPANEAIVAEVLCRGYLPAANPAEVTVEVINAFTFLAPAPAPAAEAPSSSPRRLLQAVPLLRRQAVQQQQPERQRPAGAQQRAAEAQAPAEQPKRLQGEAAGPAPAVAQPEQEAATAPAPAKQPERQQGEPAAPAPAVAQLEQEAVAAPAPAKQPERHQEAGAAPAPAAAQPGRRRRVPAAEAPAPAERGEPPSADEPPRRRQGAATERTAEPAPAPAAEEAGERRGAAAAKLPAPAPAPAAEEASKREGREEKQRRQRQERQQQEGKDRDAPARKEQAEPQQMVTGVGVELKITLPSKLSRAAAELDAVEGAVTVGKLAQDLTAAGLVVDTATMVAAYVEEPQPLLESSSPAAWQAGAPAAAL